ncbi:hypothetical protein HWV62_5871 [Athelia sp. TMB]|nr:hypothetical protein HWV62_7054 [Athelia sp. TMB]KAF7976707.1 hypothetical protein HWV62_5871 [Athelia sp. TMB]
MFSFSKIAVFATLTLSVFTSAKPFAREASVQGAEAILTNLKTAVTPLAAQLASVKSNNATAGVVGPIVDKITAAISTATTSAKALKGQPQDVVLSSATSDEIVPLQNVAKLVTDILVLLVPTVVGLARIVGPGGDLTGVLPPIGVGLSGLLGALVLGVAGLVTELIPVVQGLLAGLGGLVTTLGLGGLLIALGL